VVLISLDGWGLAPPSSGNAISQAKTPNMNYFYANYPHGQLIASGESVGLPATEVGNSEVGHLTMGVGKVIYQSLKRINTSINDGSFYENQAFTKATQHVLQNKSKIHLVGLIGSGNVHSSTDHLYALVQFCKKSGLNEAYLHLFTDGRDAPPNEAGSVIAEIQSKLALAKIGTIATISGRYYAMDRDSRWERIRRAYDAMVLGVGKVGKDPVVAINQSYAEGKSDEFIEPIVFPIGDKLVTIDDNDACIFFNFRVDRARELTMAFVFPNFEEINIKDFGFQEDKTKTFFGSTFQRQKKLKNLFFVTMTEYAKDFPVSAVAFPPQYNFPNSLPEIFYKNNINTLHLAESEKERMVTYYFRGMNATAFPTESVTIVASPRVPTYDKKPEMSIDQIVREFKRAFSKEIYRFTVINFANPDMVAHSGNITATVQAIEKVDRVLGDISHFVSDRDGVLVITADHGNAEELTTFPNKSFYYTTDKGERNTDHSNNPVPLIIITESLKGKTGDLKGTLADIAPTILAIMNLPIPDTMTGKSLLGGIKNA